MIAGPSATILVVAADPRIGAAAAGFLEPAGHPVRSIGPADDPAAILPAGAAAVLLVDWSLTGAGGLHLGTGLRRAMPSAWIVALVPVDSRQAEPAGWDAVATLPLARDSLVRALEGRLPRNGTSPAAM
ncbi:hypothetical protein ACFOGJ_26535 [Marinibaculum pumilum]|uniref:Response regulatory domain-containing protein n=1 Tax=Marinibaculum pumilum TaxID=1766165 RepID=A0ABV7L866_9PROT